MGAFWRRFGPGLLSVGLVFLLWGIGAAAFGLSILLPGPLETLQRLGEIVLTAAFWQGLAGSALRTLGGFLLSLLIAFPIGTAMGYWPFLDRFFAPWLVLLRSTPVISVILLGVLWFSPLMAPVFVCFLMVVPILAGAIGQGVKQQDRHLLELARCLHWPFLTRLRHLALPSVRPFLQNASHFGLGTAWKAVAAAEVLSQPAWGLGTRLQDARSNLDIAAVFGITLAIIVLSVLGDLGLHLIFRLGRERYPSLATEQAQQPGAAA